ncbi:hypothetical protein BC940DRAFT_288446 [Gongronella butleri]|nr:hypothetical protein BC940DRAFT_288446 [Gongronella butleri]
MNPQDTDRNSQVGRNQQQDQNSRGRGRGRGDSSRGRGRGESSRGRGRGDSTCGRGRGESSRGRGRGDSTRGRGRGGRKLGSFNNDQKSMLISERLSTVQIASDCTDDLIIAPVVDQNILHIPGWVLTKEFPDKDRPGFTYFATQRLIRNFVNALLVNLSDHHEIDTSELLPAMASETGSKQLKEIMTHPNISTFAGDKKEYVSFQYVILPLIGVFTRHSLCHSSLDAAFKVYNLIYLNQFEFLERRVLPCMQKLIGNKFMADMSPSGEELRNKGGNNNLCQVSTVCRAMLSVVRLVYQLLKKFQSAKIELAKVVTDLHNMTLKTLEIREGDEFDNYVRYLLKQESARLVEIVTEVKLKADPDTALGTLQQPSNTTAGTNMVALEHDYDPPGELSTSGPRHDNDRVYIAEIQVLPTQSEILSMRAPFLPSNDVIGAPHFLPHGWDRHLDIHFRLGREDLMNSLRKGMQIFVDLLIKSDAANQNQLLVRSNLRKYLQGDSMVNAYGNVKFRRLVTANRNHGAEFEISFTQPEQLKNVPSVSKREQFWEKSKRRLMHSGLVCFIRRRQGDDKPLDMAFGVITNRDINSLSKDAKEAVICVSLANIKQCALVMDISARDDVPLLEQWFMVESVGAFMEAYRPVLEALKNCGPASLPFGKYIAPTEHERQQWTEQGSLTIDPPVYTRSPRFTFDLSSLVKGKPCSVNVHDPVSVQDAVKCLQERSRLDPTQSVALVDALRREIALISGPPGTGKTWLGVDLMRILLANRLEIKSGPIVCLCYTNHALDQFLEQLLDLGVKNMVRIGSRSKSEQLADYNLESRVSLLQRSVASKRAFGEAKSAINDMTDRLKKLESDLNSDILSESSTAMIYLLMEDPLLHDQFADADESGHASDGEEWTTSESSKFRGAFWRWANCSDIKAAENYNGMLAEKRNHAQQKKKQHANIYKLLSTDDYDDDDEEEGVPRAIPNTDRPLEELKMAGIWSHSRVERKRVLEWINHGVRESIWRQYTDCIQALEQKATSLQNVKDEDRRQVLKSAHVIGLTTTGAAKVQKLLNSLAPRIIICEEAGEVLESHVLAALSHSTQHLILIGDHLQLRPQVANYNLSSESLIGRQYNLDRSLFERLVAAPPQFALPRSQLLTQRRMRPEISNLIRSTLYPDLEDGELVESYPPVGGMGSNLFFYDHVHPEDSKDQYGMQSCANSFEVDMIEALAQHLIKNGYDQPGDIAILTPYLGQLAKLRDRLRKSFTLAIDDKDLEQLDQVEGIQDQDSATGPLANPNVVKKSLQQQLILRTIDNYQGEEATIVIISLVRSNFRADSAVESQNIGFVRSSNRINVLLSRAKHGMFILGNAKLMDKKQNGIWPKIMAELRQHKRIGLKWPVVCQTHPNKMQYIGDPAEFKKFAPDGGCDLMCRGRMTCGHTCPQACHPNDREHQLVKCMEPCTKLLKPCGHVCMKKCGELCGACTEPVGTIDLPCGHKYENARCFQKHNPENLCRERLVLKFTGCEHEGTLRCGDDLSTFKCLEECGVLLECGHKCLSKCCKCQDVTREASGVSTNADNQNAFLRTQHAPCEHKCDKPSAFCSHRCSSACHDSKSCPPCERPCAVRCQHSTCSMVCSKPCGICAKTCAWQCEHQGSCSLPCGASCDRLPCNERCTKEFDCGHRCVSICGEPCPSKAFCVVCRHPETMNMMVDFTMQETLGNIDVDRDPIIQLACNHALTVSTLDGMFDIGQYYEATMDNETGIANCTGVKPLLGSSNSVVTCPLCREPITSPLRYGRCIKNAQLDMAMRRFEVQQSISIKGIQKDSNTAKDRLEHYRPELMEQVAATVQDSIAAPHPPRKQLKTPGMIDSLSEYQISEHHDKAWKEFIKPVKEVMKKISGVLRYASRSPTIKVYEAAVAQLYRSKKDGIISSLAVSTSSKTFTEDLQLTPEEVDALVQHCNDYVVMSGLPPNGYGGSSLALANQERVNLLKMVVVHAMNLVNNLDELHSTGWHWFVKDLIELCYAHTGRQIETGKACSHPRVEMYGRFAKIELLLYRLQWIGYKPFPSDSADVQQRLALVEELLSIVKNEKRAIEESQFIGLRDELLPRVEELSQPMDTACKIARNEMASASLSRNVKLEVFCAIQADLTGSGHWYRCANGHPYVIADCGMAMQESRCPECGTQVGGRDHRLVAGNQRDEEFEALHDIYSRR